MFPSAGSSMYEHTKRALGLVARAIQEMPQKISISGHTDAVPFNDAGGRSNWELSADRALASRRALIGAGVPESRIARIVGRAETDPLLPDDPRAAGNRRISIVLLRDLSGAPAPPPPQSVMPPRPLTRVRPRSDLFPLHSSIWGKSILVCLDFS